MLEAFCVVLYFIVGLICLFLTNLKIKIDEKNDNAWWDHDRVPMLIASFFAWPIVLFCIICYQAYCGLDILSNQIIESIYKNDKE